MANPYTKENPYKQAVMKKEIPEIEATHQAAKILARSCHNRAWNAGWWHDLKPARGLTEMCRKCFA